MLSWTRNHGRNVYLDILQIKIDIMNK